MREFQTCNMRKQFLPVHSVTFLCASTPDRWLHLECERQNSGQADIQPREDYVCSNCKSPAEEPAGDMDVDPEPSSQPASVHTHSETGPQLAEKHTDPDFGTQLSPEMHNDSKAELLADQLHSDPEPVQATVQEEKLSMLATESGRYLLHKTMYMCIEVVAKICFTCTNALY